MNEVIGEPFPLLCLQISKNEVGLACPFLHLLVVICPELGQHDQFGGQLWRRSVLDEKEHQLKAPSVSEGLFPEQQLNGKRPFSQGEEDIPINKFKHLRSPLNYLLHTKVTHL